MKAVAVILSVVFALHAAAAVAEEPPDLSSISRTIASQPTYTSDQPLYGLYVFGPEAKTRVWAVLDKSTPTSPQYDVLFFDKNADGDLTGEDERITGGGKFEIGSFTDPATGDIHTELSISLRDGAAESIMFRMNWRGEHACMGGYAPVAGPYTQFAATPEEAPVLWPGGEGPLSFERWEWQDLPIGGSSDVRVLVGHQGVGKNTFCGLHQGFLPPETPVLATLIYTDRQGKEQRVANELRERC